mmetsp:Transcript_55791/g.147495  ORF Transcript_55791/g.147495 Transcript_55791/m.147495 type:complete len:86 (+) Transcript_55791:1126-1383(+)
MDVFSSWISHDSSEEDGRSRCLFVVDLKRLTGSGLVSFGSVFAGLTVASSSLDESEPAPSQAFSFFLPEGSFKPCNKGDFSSAFP